MYKDMTTSELIDMLIEIAFQYDNEDELDEQMNDIKREIIKRTLIKPSKSQLETFMEH